MSNPVLFGDHWGLMAAVLRVSPWDEDGPGSMVCRHCGGCLPAQDPHLFGCPWKAMWLIVHERANLLRTQAELDIEQADRLRDAIGWLSRNGS